MSAAPPARPRRPLHPLPTESDRREIDTAGRSHGWARSHVTALIAAALAAAPPPPRRRRASTARPGSMAPDAGSADDRTPPSDLFRIDPTRATRPRGRDRVPVTGLALDPTSGTLYGVTAGVEQSTAAPADQARLEHGRGHRRRVHAAPARSMTSRSTPRAAFGWNTRHGRPRHDRQGDAAPSHAVGDSGVSETYGGGLSFDPAGRLHALVDLDYGHLWTANTGIGQAHARAPG